MIRKELHIESDEDIRDFLRDALRNAGIAEPIRIKPAPPRSTTYDAFAEGEDILSIALIDKGGDSIDIQGTKVHDNYKRRGLGAIGLECSLLTMSLLNKTHAIIKDISHDGHSFWLRMGGLPHIVEDSQKQEFSRQLLGRVQAFKDFNHDVLEGETVKKFDFFEENALKNPFWICNQISQMDDIRKIGGKVSQLFFSHSMFKCDYILIPGEPATRKILEKRVRFVPPFRDVSEKFPLLTRELKAAPAGWRFGTASLNAG